ncbi:MAG: GNAT family N-acetyltransferase [Gorillibacterium sp.]|nr:GNAT family N-acetyltransferase [Gorillibacterium sp.]
MINKLDEFLLTRYKPEEIYVLDFFAPDIHEVLFVVCYLGDQPIGCGAIRKLADNSMELKRFFVDTDYRRRGIAKEMLNYLEEKTIESGYTSVKLETGVYQPEAIEFYLKNDYKEISRFGSYDEDPLSLYYEKVLA